ncbi:MarR family winged helix-turn-helix transcriptional regulator [Aquabacterium sp.]|uniref:MarR family winged helix-turn-helix transcriptional regulator n=1 Tax=Aquabacterium sp. TaxID=1872578 RepID=UPI0025C2E1DD|nr:MarR family transcriptional regulator [Aquabacterium sp.]
MTSPAGAPSSPPAVASEAQADFLALDQQLCFALHASSLAMTKAYKPLLAPLGLTYPQYLVMLVLWEQDGRTVLELGQALHLDSGTLTPLLKRMATSGWLSRHRDPEDERRVRIQLTEAGQRLRDDAKAVPVAMACQLGMGEAEFTQLRQTLLGLQARLQSPPKPKA